MRKTVIGIIAGVVAGVVIGTTLVGPRLVLNPTPAPNAKQPPAAPAKEPVTAALPLAGTQLAGLAATRWRLAAAYNRSLPQVGELADRVETVLWRISGGGFELKAYPPGKLAPTDRILDAVAAGTVDAAFITPEALAARNTALQLFAGAPFGPSARARLAWTYFGGGRELANRMFNKLGVQALPCGALAPEAGGWFRAQVRTVEDLGGLRIRMGGLGARVMEKLGAIPKNLKAEDIFVALENGELDAVSFSMPAVDAQLKLNDMARFYYFPGWQRPATLFHLVINLDRWRALSAVRKAQLETVCGDAVRDALASSEAVQFAALKDLTAKGVVISRWPTEVMAALKAAWREVVSEENAQNPDFREVWEALTAFERDFDIWRELATY
ncbi:MAG: TRAP transporter substrate-binding protein [Rhodobacterales bacterium]|nr:TRAP transporter substrate-binding protein [Rhodobacterales bacterium]